MKTIRTYSELIILPTFEERYRYLKLDGKVGEITFGYDRCLYETFLKTDEWLALRDYVISLHLYTAFPFFAVMIVEPFLLYTATPE